MYKDTPVHPWYPQSTEQDSDGLLWYDECWWGPNYFGVSLSLSSSSSLLSLPLAGEALACQELTHAGACADGFLWLPRGSMRLSGAPYRFGTWKCGGEDHGGWQENTPI